MTCSGDIKVGDQVFVNLPEDAEDWQHWVGEIRLLDQHVFTVDLIDSAGDVLLDCNHLSGWNLYLPKKWLTHTSIESQESPEAVAQEEEDLFW